MTTHSTVEIEIDGKKLNAKAGSMVIEVADDAGIPIPRFCYHNKLSIAANCRMCLVEVEKVGKPLPACATPVTSGMKVFTQSAKARQAQRAVMEFLLINHPLDCPICDQGGECELQDISLEYGNDLSRFTEGKRAFPNEDIGPLVATEMTRCIQCTRCVRFGDEIAGVRELGALGRGEHTWIGTYVKKSLQSEIAANIIDLCPVGALTSKPYQYAARAWELRQHRSIAAHDCLGSHLFIHTRKQDVMRVVPRHCESLNEVWLADRDRFSYEGIHSPERVTRPMVKINGAWEEVEWDIALRTSVAKIAGSLSQYQPEQLAAFISPNATTEELYLYQKLWRSLACHNIDHRVHQTDFSDQANRPTLPIMEHLRVSDIEQQDTILLIGSYVQHEQPLIATRIRKAQIQGAKVFAINPIDYAFSFDLAGKIIDEPTQLIQNLINLCHVLSEKTQKPLPSFIKQAAQMSTTQTLNDLADTLLASEKPLVLLGEFAQNHPQAASFRALSHVIAELTEAKTLELSYGANTAGAYLAGALPHRKAAGHLENQTGINIKEAIHQSLKAYVLFGLDPAKDFAYSRDLEKALSQAEIVIAFSAFKDRALLEHAQVILPISTFAESSGTFINIEGHWQSFSGAVAPKGEARPGWKVLCALANFLDLPGFDYDSSEVIKDELAQLKIQAHHATYHPNFHEKEKTQLTRLSAWPIYRTDQLVRHAKSLQATPINPAPAAYLHPKMAAKLHLHDAKQVSVIQDTVTVVLPLILDERIAENCVYIPAGFEETAKLNANFHDVSLASVRA